MCSSIQTQEGNANTRIVGRTEVFGGLQEVPQVLVCTSGEKHLSDVGRSHMPANGASNVVCTPH